MDSRRPENLSRQLIELLGKGDMDGILDLYESDAVFADTEGTARGPAQIRAAHRSFLDSGLTLTLDDSVVLEAGDIALVHWSWTVERGDGSVIEGVSAEVMRRQPDGTWKYIIDNSDGSALVGLT